MANVKKIWKEVPTVDLLEVSNYGEARTFIRAVHRKMRYRDIKPYYKLDYQYIGVGGKEYALHILIAKTFIENPDNLPQVNHIKGNKSDNRAWMLEWCTSQYNTYHAIYELGHTTNFGRKKVRVIKDGEVVCEQPTVREAAKFVDGKSTHVSQVCKGTRTHHKGYQFEYL